MGGEDCNGAGVGDHRFRKLVDPVAEVVFVHDDGVDYFTGIA